MALDTCGVAKNPRFSNEDLEQIVSEDPQKIALYNPTWLHEALVELLEFRRNDAYRKSFDGEDQW